MAAAPNISGNNLTTLPGQFMEDKRLDFCLLIPCYNNFRGLTVSLKSVFYDADRLAVVVVDDGSNVAISSKELKSELKNIDSITVLRNEENRGITRSLNLGLKWIEEHLQVKYVARLDCGDRCHPHRFYKQVEYMNKHPDIGLLGSWCLFEDKKSLYKYQYTTPTEHEGIMRQMHWRNVFIHPTVIYRADLLKTSGCYPTDFLYAEDYAFCWKLIKIASSHILGEFLVTCEINKEGLSFANRNKQLLAQKQVINEYATNSFMKMAGILRLKTLSIIPKRLVLPLKRLIKER